MRSEGPDRRDIAFYIRDPHVLLATAPQELFLDPSHTYRLDLSTYRGRKRRKPRGFFVRRLSSEDDADAVNRIYSARHMVPVPPQFFWSRRDSRAITYFVAEDEVTGDIIGTVTGIDHQSAFNDPEKGSSLWCLAVDPRRRIRVSERRWSTASPNISRRAAPPIWTCPCCTTTNRRSPFTRSSALSVSRFSR
jgi:ribosomal protein S18 acetylase RimI-like enzyme